jgi:amino acid adenylation domain-containing protein
VQPEISTITVPEIVEPQQDLSSFPLSPVQRRIWSLRQDAPGLGVYAAFSVPGPVDRNKLQRALECLVQRHEILRTIFVLPPGDMEPVQEIKVAAGAYTFSVLEWDDPTGSEKALQAALDEAAQQQFDLQEGPLFNVALVADRESRSYLVLSLPAICGDAQTLRVLAHELLALYEAGADINLPEILQFAEVAEWQNSLLRSEDTDDGKTHWLASELFGLPLASDHSGKSFEYKVLTAAMAAADFAGLTAAAQRCGSSVADFLLTCWQILIGRLQGDEPATIGLLLDGRKFQEVKDVVGPFARYVPLRSDVSLEHPLRDVLARTKGRVEDARKFQDFFEWPQGDPGTSSARPRYFSVCFDFHDANAGSQGLEIIEEHACTDRFALKIACIAGWPGLLLKFHYDPNAYTREYVGCIAETFEQLLRSAVQRPDLPVGRLPILPERQARQLVIEANRTETDLPGEPCFHHLFEAQVALHSDAIAVRAGKKTMTYAELNLRSNQLAHWLRKQGVREEVRVGLFMPRSPELMIALLGVLKAGGAYVPLDSNNPQERLVFILEDAAPRLVLTVKALAPRLPGNMQAQVISMEDQEKTLKRQPTENLYHRVMPETLAYVIYTSGSTGRPKGAMISHRGLSNYLLWCKTAYPVDEGEGSPFFSPLAFDLTVTSLFVPLLSAKAVFVVLEEDSLQSLFTGHCPDKGYSFVKLTPAHLQLLNLSFSGKTIENWTHSLVIGGEALTTDLVSSCLRNFPQARIFNEYGPTETVVGCCMHEVRGAVLESSTAPIGRPIANTTMYVLNEEMEPMPVGVAGEIYIGGEGLARGYVGRPDLTAERFVANPFGAKPGERLYRTGDLGRWLQDETIECLGRTDYQVKIRGYRVELHEIEAVLEQQPEVAQAAVAAPLDESGEKFLVAYFVPVDATSKTVRDLKDRLKSRLPHYMVPSVYIRLKTMPLTANGKIDRRALPPPDRHSSRIVPDYLGARDPIEAELVRIFEEVLNGGPVGVNDDFFELGGHSMIAVRLTALITASFEVEVPVSALFASPTVAQLAELLRNRKTDIQSASLVLIRDGGPGRPFFCVHPIGGGVLCYAHLAMSMPAGRRFYGLQVPDSAQPETFESGIETIAARYNAAILSVQPEGPYLLGGHSFGALIALEMAQQLTAAGKRVDLLAVMDMGLDWPKPPADADDAAILFHLFGPLLDASIDDFRKLRPWQKISRIIEAAKKTIFVPTEIPQERIRRFVQMCKALHRAQSQYEAQPYAGRVTLFKAAEVLDQRFSATDPSLGWERVSPGNLQIHTTAGNHYSMVEQPHVQVLADQLQICIESIESEGA